MAELTCPKCGSPMRSYERNGITVDQCTGCRGLFLDRGELERLIDAEGAFYEGSAAPAEPARPQRVERPDFEHRREDHRYEDHRREDHHYGKRKKKKGFLDEFLDFG